MLDRIAEHIPTPFLIALLVAIVAAAGFARVWLRERRRSDRARREALLDPLTGIVNRLGFEERLRSEWRRARRYSRPLGVLLLDLDGLKQINDRYGHAAGDRALQSVAGLIEGDIRGSDVAARLGGDEFVVLCPETGFAALAQLAENLRLRLDADAFGMSVGYAELAAHDERPENMLERADAAMYQDKLRRSASSRAATAPQARATPGLSAQAAS